MKRKGVDSGEVRSRMGIVGVRPPSILPPMILERYDSRGVRERGSRSKAQARTNGDQRSASVG